MLRGISLSYPREFYFILFLFGVDCLAMLEVNRKRHHQQEGVEEKKKKEMK
jgi:hypothetical protein